VAGVDSPMVPFVARNQGRWTDSDLAFAAFEQAFPNNSPSFFCFAAMQGVAQAVGMDQLVAIKRSVHPAYDPDSVKHFANAYDGFWKILGGVELPGPGYLIALPFYLKPLSDMPRKHRKRAAARHEYWGEIGAARGTLERKLKRNAGASRAQGCDARGRASVIPAAPSAAAPHSTPSRTCS
jgi:hypothetical protein